MLLLILLLLVWPSAVYAQLAPVDGQSTLMKGLVGQWIVQPPQMGGITWFPQVGLDKGTLVGMSTADSGWQPTKRPGGAGEMRFDGTDDQVNIGTTVLLANLPAFTVCLWFRSTTTAAQQLYTENDSTWPDMSLVINWNGPTTITLINYDDVSGGMETVGTSPVAIDSNTWIHVCGVQFSKSSAGVYFNGKLTSGASTGSINITTPTARALGSTPQGSNRLLGALDDIRTYTRALSASEVAQLYQQSSRAMLQQALRGNGVFAASVFRGSLMPFFSLP
jgi:hypothetical protein